MSTEQGFRELFVELPRQLFDVLKGIGEQAVREAQEPAHDRKPSRSRALVESAARIIRERYGWIDCRASRMALQDSYEMAPRLACGHWHRIEIPYTRLVANPSMRVALLGILDDAADERSCYCVPMEAP